MSMKRFETGFQFLLNSLRNPNSDKWLSSILWTGAAPGVGVTTLALGFTSFVAREMGQTVLLCDTNYKNKQITQSWELDKAPGFAEFLAGESSMEDVVHQTGFPGLYVLPCGAHKLLATVMVAWKKRPKETISKLSESFGLVIFDSAPPNTSPEACFLGSQVDGVLLVVNSEKTRRQVFKATVDRLESTGSNIVGGILNRRKFHIPSWIYRHLG